MNSTLKIGYTVNNLALTCSVFDAEMYQSKCFQELLELMKSDEFLFDYNYAIYTDSYIVAENAFTPYFHTYYLNSDKKDVILLDEKMIDLPEVYDHHNFYIYDNEELLKIYKEKYPNLEIKNIKSLKEIDNVPKDE